MRVAIAGAGYVGLVSGVCLAEQGHEVTCVDLDPGKVARINDGKAPIHEEGLDALLARRVGQGFRATTSLEDAVGNAELTIIAVGTPFDGQRIDLQAIQTVSAQIGKALRHQPAYHVVVVKSTVIPGTTETVVGPALEKGSGKKLGPDIGLGMNPEFLTEGQAIRDFLNPDRIVVGAIDDRSHEVIAALYQGFATTPYVKTNPSTAEMIKYASNAMLATAISFTNELANLCTTLGGIDIVEVTRGVHFSQYLTPRLDDGRRVRAPLASFYEAGCGFGGSCLPKDVKALAAQGRERGSPMAVLEAVLQVNSAQHERILDLLRLHFATVANRRIAVLGVAFKPDTDDIRESPGLRIVDLLLREGARVTIYDPAALSHVQGRFPSDQVRVATSLSDALEDAEAVVLATSWEEFRCVPGLIADRRSPPLVIDGRRMLPPDSVPLYEGIGRRLQ